MLVSLVAILVGLQDPPIGVAMAERISRRIEASAAADCDVALAEADVRNAELLFTGAGICDSVQRPDDGAFLTLAAQARAMADIELILPEDSGDPGEAQSERWQPPFEVLDLYAFIYAYGGGAGLSEIYRDPVRSDRLFSRMDGWAPRRSADYNPGWEGSRASTDEAYSVSVRAHVSARNDQLLGLAKLYRDDAYYALQTELEALMLANNNTFEEGSPASLRFNAIMAEQAEIAQRLGHQP